MLFFSSPLGNGSLTRTAYARPKIPHPRRAAILLNTPSEIVPRLWLSGLATAIDDEQLIALGVTHIVSAIEQRPPYPRTLPKLKTLHVPVQDVNGADILQYLDTTTAFIKSALEDPRNTVLVHCAMGISRSATVVCAYLIATHALRPADALARVVSKREVVCPNLGFRHQLEIYAARLRGHRKLRRGGTPRPRAMSYSYSTSASTSTRTLVAERIRRLWPAFEAQTPPPQTRSLPPPLPVSRRGSMG